MSTITFVIAGSLPLTAQTTATAPTHREAELRSRRSDRIRRGDDAVAPAAPAPGGQRRLLHLPGPPLEGLPTTGRAAVGDGGPSRIVGGSISREGGDPAEGA